MQCEGCYDSDPEEFRRFFPQRQSSQSSCSPSISTSVHTSFPTLPQIPSGCHAGAGGQPSGRRGVPTAAESASVPCVNFVCSMPLQKKQGTRILHARCFTRLEPNGVGILCAGLDLNRFGPELFIRGIRHRRTLCASESDGTVDQRPSLPPKPHIPCPYRVVPRSLRTHPGLHRRPHGQDTQGGPARDGGRRRVGRDHQRGAGSGHGLRHGPSGRGEFNFSQLTKSTSWCRSWFEG